MLQPKKLAWRKQRKGRITGNETRGTTLAFGEFGLKAIESERITARQIEAARRAISRQMKRQGKIFIRPNKVDPTKPDYYWLEGFKVRNMSQRQDGTYWTNGSVHQFKTSN